MTLDIRPLLRGETNRIDIDYTLVPEKIQGVEFKDAVIKGAVTDSAGYMRLVISAEVEYSSECARCLEPVSGKFQMDFERTVSDAKTLSKEAIEENDGEYAKNNENERDRISRSISRRYVVSSSSFAKSSKCGS